jgi:hypothetical protein
MDSYTKIAGRFLRHGLVAGLLLFTALPAHAASVSFFLDQSNKLPDGTNYLSVMLTENETGGVDFLVKTLAPLNDIAGSNFGIQKFGFSFVDGSWGEINSFTDHKHGKSNRHEDDFWKHKKHKTWDQISDLPDHWSVQNNKRMDGFGKFDIRLVGRGNARTDSLSFTVDGVSLDDFGSLFSAHVAGFEWCTIDDRWRNWCDGKNCTTSALFAGSMSVPQVPIPAAVWLFGSGLLGLAVVTRRKNRDDIPLVASYKTVEVLSMEDLS